MAIGTAIETEGGRGTAAIKAEHVALAAGRVGVERASGKEMGREQGL